MNIKLLTEQHLEFLSLNGDCTGVYTCQNVTLLEIICHGSIIMIITFAVYITKFYMNLAHIYRSSLYSIEIVEDLPNVDVVMVPCGGGGLIGGIALYLKHYNPSIQVCLLHSPAV